MNRSFRMWAFTAVISLFASFSLVAQPPKREFRGVWIASVANIDWPSAKGLDREAQQAEFIRMLDAAAATGLNAVIVQVRPSADALYRSKLEPWSEWLTGEQGKKPGYDPLRFMVTEAHRRGLEFHAWLNPYRAVFQHGKSSIYKKSILEKHPEWLVEYGKSKLFDPGLPEVRQHVTAVIGDLVRRYDIDAIHFDDYFYPYPIANMAFPDSASFARFGKGFASLGDWRRHNIDLLIQSVQAEIRRHDPRVKFGISPFGVWRNKASDPFGSDTRAGAPTFDSLYADIRKWQQLGWVDYMLPQIYWPMDFPAAAFRKLAPWWAENAFERHVYIGHGVYRVGTAADSAWHNPNQLACQLDLVRELRPQLQGSAFFSMKWFFTNHLGFVDSLKTQHYARPALLPTMPWLDATPPEPVRKPRFRAGVLTWKQPRKAADSERARAYAIYRIPEGERPEFSDGSQLWVISTEKSFPIPPENGKKYRYFIATLDRLHNESTPLEAR
jgi:uncharacterized lipoprotein YddW (UPF0748 family)